MRTLHIAHAFVRECIGAIPCWLTTLGYSFRHLILVAAGLVSTLTVAIKELSAAEGGELPLIRATLREYLTSVTSIEVKYSGWHAPQKGSPSQDPWKGRSWGPQHFEWAEQGRQKLMKAGPIPLDDFPQVQFFGTHDGRTAYYVDYEPGNISKIRMIIKTPDINPAYYDFPCPAIFMGLRIPQSEQSFLALLERSGPKVEGRESVTGIPCWKVDLGRYKSNAGFEHSCTAWLDSDCGYLPRRVVVKLIDDSPKLVPSAKGDERAFEVIKFSRVRDHLLGTERWFPTEMRFESRYETGRFVVDEVEINKPIPLERFQPRPQVGTEIIEGPMIPFEPARSYIVGGKDTI
jgi:hypothetical protein